MADCTLQSKSNNFKFLKSEAWYQGRTEEFHLSRNPLKLFASLDLTIFPPAICFFWETNSSPSSLFWKVSRCCCFRTVTHLFSSASGRSDLYCSYPDLCLYSQTLQIEILLSLFWASSLLSFPWVYFRVCLQFC